MRADLRVAVEAERVAAVARRDDLARAEAALVLSAENRAASEREVVAAARRLALVDPAAKVSELAALEDELHAAQDLQRNAVRAVAEASSHAAAARAAAHQAPQAWLVSARAAEQWRAIGREDRAASAERRAEDAFDAAGVE